MSFSGIQIEKIVGRVSNGEATGVFSKRLEFVDGTFGTLVVCLFLKSENGDLQLIASDLFEITCRKIEDSSLQILEALSHAVEAAADYLEDKEIQLSISLLLFLEEAVYLVRRGSGIKIFVFDDLHHEEISFESGSGFLHGGQIFLAATEAFLAGFDVSKLKKTGGDLEDLVDGLATEIFSWEKQGGVAAVFVKIKNEKKGSENTQSKGEEPDESEKLEIGSEKAGEDFGDGDESLGEQTAFGKGDTFGFWGKISRFLNLVKRELLLLKSGEVKSILALRRKIVVVIAVIVLVLLGSVSFTLWQKSQSQKEERFRSHLSEASDFYNRAVALIELNSSRAREILIEGEKAVKLALEIKPNDQEAKRLEGDFAQKLKQTEVTEGLEFRVFSEFNSYLNSLSFLGNNLIASSEGQVYEIDLADGKTRKVGEREGIENSFAYDNMGFLLTGDGVYKVNLGTGASERIIGAKNGFRDMAVFLGNIYLLRGEGIDKYVPLEGGYSDPGDYLNVSTVFEGDLRFAIDGFIWVTSGQKIYKFNRGDDESFQVSGLSGEVGEFGPIYTAIGVENLYVVDRLNSVLLVIDKEGVYKKAYQSPEFEKAADIVVDEEIQKLYLAKEGRILEAGL